MLNFIVDIEQAKDMFHGKQAQNIQCNQKCKDLLLIILH